MALLLSCHFYAVRLISTRIQVANKTVLRWDGACIRLKARQEFFQPRVVYRLLSFMAPYLLAFGGFAILFSSHLSGFMIFVGLNLLSE